MVAKQNRIGERGVIVNRVLASMIGGSALAAGALFVTGGSVDTVSGASVFRTNASSAGWCYPADHSYTSVFFVGVRQSIPIVYAGEDWDYLAAWSQSPNLGGSFEPENSTDSKYWWAPPSTGTFSSSFTVHSPGNPSMGYQQTFHFLVRSPRGDTTTAVTGSCINAPATVAGGSNVADKVQR